jgi:hypothetical protein
MYDILLILLFILDSLLFFFLGRYTRSLKFTHKDPLDESLDSIVEKAKTVVIKKKLLPGILPIKTPEERADELSGEKALDEHWKHSGIAKEILK